MTTVGNLLVNFSADTTDASRALNRAAEAIARVVDDRSSAGIDEIVFEIGTDGFSLLSDEDERCMPDHSYFPLRWLALRDRVDVLGVALRLRGWRVVIFTDPPDDEKHNAAAQVVYGRRVIRLWFADSFFAQTARDQTQTILHELLHAWFNPVINAVINTYGTLLDENTMTWTLVNERLVDDVEIVVDELANAFAALVSPADKIA